MAKPTTASDLLRRYTGGLSGAPEILFAHKTMLRVNGGSAASAAAVLGGEYLSLWTYDGQPGYGVAPGTTPRNPTRATAGALAQTNPSSGRQKWLTYLNFSSGVSAASASMQNNTILYDRLADVSGLVANSTSLQTIGGGGLTLSRYTDGLGVELWVEIYTTIGTTTSVLTVNYTNTASVSKSATIPVFGTAGQDEAGRIFKVLLASGDLGVLSVQSVQLSASTGTAGDFGVTLVRPLVAINNYNSAMGTQASQLENLIEIKSDACLAWITAPSAAQEHHHFAQLSFVEA